jgi:hypothetical protein
MSDERSMCPIPHRDETPRSSTTGTVLCKGHEQGVLRVLAELETFDADADELTEGRTARHDTAPLTGTGEKPLPIDLRLADLRLGWTDSEGPHNGIRATFVSWVKFVADERELAVPEDTLPALSRFLRRHHAFLVGHELAAGYATEILELGRLAHALFNPSGVRKWTAERYMRCPESIFDDAGEFVRCDGTLWALLTPDDPYFDVGNELVCDACETRTPSTEWLTLGRRVRAA